MRDVLVPAKLAESCSLRQGLRWIVAHEYPLEDRSAQILAEMANTDGDTDSVGPAHELAREQLFAQLNTGNITARGCMTEREPPPENGPDNELKALSISIAWSAFSFAERSEPHPIPLGAWRMQNILWERNALRTPKGHYVNIEIPTKALFERFPEPRLASASGVEQRGRTLLTSPEAQPETVGEKRRGRPREYNWDLFHAQVAKFVLEHGGLPQVKAALAKAMQEWCAKNWDKEPADSVMREKLAWYYAVIGGSASPKKRDS